jgi:predicted RNA-binding protein with PIN domain
MAIHLAIDGYNLLGASTGRGLGVSDIDRERENLINRLKTYKRVKGCKVTVVFDARGSGRLARSKEKKDGIDVIFSGAGEEADRILKEMAREKGPALTVVTSDRDVRGYADSQGSVVITSGTFAGLLERTLYMDMKGLEETEEEQRKGGKRGPSKRASKRVQRRRRKLKKL